MVNVVVIGARGYLGRECIRILLNHPKVQSVTPVSGSGAGKPYGDLVPGFRGRDLTFVAASDAKVTAADVLFLATDAEEARKAVAAARPDQLVIDLSRAHRHAAFEKGTAWTYGQPELLPVPKGHKRVANPGCYPTATMLAAAPALKGKLAADGVLISDGISGVSGAGATPRGDLHFPEANESVRAYKVLGHDHLGEIRDVAQAVEKGGNARAVRFTPHLVPQNRGLLATVYLPLRPGVTAEQVKAAYAAAYADTPFVHLVAEADTGAVRGSNRAEVAVDVDLEAGLIVARCAIDNLVKGGSGNAVQNMNAALGFEPSLGLPFVGGGP
ncbi:MAG TPA: N-acetyl-gamma-glutamyl-phosphate reductase [Candidatus Thermoplasmatota archaeon]|nr:N-acetyl-gamma-glutamyl-phosphate reductase [Candidatus Thermoplasmatota archaeon]